MLDKKYCVFTDSGINEYYIKQFGCKYFGEKKFETKVINISRLTRPNIKVPLIFSNGESTQIDVKSYEELYKILSQVGNSLCLIKLARENLLNLFLISYLKRKNCIVGVEVVGFDSKNKFSKQSKLKKIISFLERNTLKELFIEVIKRVIKQSVRKRIFYDYILCINENQADNVGFRSVETKLIFGHKWESRQEIDGKSLDFDSFEHHNKRIFLFFDQSLPTHPEIIENKVLDLLGYDYYKELSVFFKKIEYASDCVVCIVPHPQANSDEISKYFAGRMVARNNLNYYLLNADLFFEHTSTALNYAVSLFKPIIFLEFDRLKGTEMHPILKDFSKKLSMPVVNFDDGDFVLFEPIPDELIYCQYIAENIDPPGGESKNWDLIYNNYFV